LTAISALPPLHDRVTVPPLVDVEALDATTIVSVPVSLPDDGLENVIQLAFDEAAHVQLPDVLVIVTVNVPPADVGDCDVEETVYAQAVGVGVVAVSFLLHADTRIPTKRSMEQISFMTVAAANRVPRNGAAQRARILHYIDTREGKCGCPWRIPNHDQPWHANELNELALRIHPWSWRKRGQDRGQSDHTSRLRKCRPYASRTLLTPPSACDRAHDSAAASDTNGYW
jgi:hypothetical protein